MEKIQILITLLLVGLAIENRALGAPASEEILADLLAPRAAAIKKEQAKPDIFLGWMNNPALEQFKPLFSQIQDSMGPMSQQVSAQILDNVPGGKEIFESIQSMQNQLGSMVSQFNPTSQIMGSLMPGNSQSGGSQSGSQSQQTSSSTQATSTTNQ